jgi:heat shock protein HslJ
VKSAGLVAVLGLLAAACAGGDGPRPGQGVDSATLAEGVASAVLTGSAGLPAEGAAGGVLDLSGMMTYAADAAVFAECRTGTTYPVAQEGAYLELERAYLRDRTGPGEPLLVRVRGTLEPRVGMEGGERVSLVVASVLGTEPGAGCGAERPDLPLEGTVWTLVELGHEPLPDGIEATLLLDRDSGRASGSGGCNTFTGPYRLAGASLTFGDVAVTARACAGPVGDLEHAYLGALTRVGGYRLLGAELQLLAEEGVVARFRSR